jgi:hypothetical protein
MIKRGQTKLTKPSGKLTKRIYLSAHGGYPLFHYRRTKLIGEMHELTLGPCIASLVKWVIIGLIGFALMMRQASATDVLAFIKMLHSF